jgi:Methyltransferase domain.
MRELRDAWSRTITAEDYEAHMAAIGQAQANAALVAEYLQAQPPSRHASLLFAGAGTGQMFEYVSPEILLPFNVTFTDINAGFLNRLRTRLARTPGLRYATVVDDLEHTTLSRRFDLVLEVLVLEHVQWRVALATLCKLTERELFVVIQENPPDDAMALTTIRDVPETMKVFREVHPTRIPSSDLQSEMKRHGFRRTYAAHKMVSDGKKMVALGFWRN